MKAIRNLVFIPFGLIIGLTVDGFEQPRHAGTPMAAIHVATAWGGTAASERVPFVGCEASDFANTGDDLPAPKDRGQAPVLPRPVAHKLAYYASADLAVLAPRGWHCHGYEQAGTATLVVSREPLNDGLEKPTGPGISLLSTSSWNGVGVSVALEVAARLPLAKKKVVQGIRDGWGLGKSDNTVDPYPDDILTRRSDGDVEFETPANKDGMGTMFGLMKNADPIRGMAIMWETMDDNKNKSGRVVLLVVRMPPNLRPLIHTIMENTRRHPDQNRYP